MTAVLLVHGAWAHATVWDQVAAELRGRGHEVEAVELHRGTLAADTLAVQSVVDALAQPVVVCGWSYGGAVITGLHLPAGSHLIYLAAFMPDQGEDVASLANRAPSDLQKIYKFDDAGDAALSGSDEDLAAVLWADVPGDLARSIRDSLSPQPVATFSSPPAFIAWRDTPSTYVVCQQDRAIPPELQRQMAGRAGQVVEWNTSHTPMLSRPVLVADLIEQTSARRA